MKPRNPLQSEITRVRRRLQLERSLKGLAVVAGCIFLATIVASLLLTRSNFSDTVLFWTRAFAGIALLLLAGRYLVVPLFRSPSLRRVARFLEERFPGLQNRVSTAIELSDETSDVHPVIRRLIIRDAREKLRGVHQPKLYNRRAGLTSVLTLAASAILFLGMFWAGPEAYRYSLNKFFSTSADDQPPLYSIEVEPGNTKVVRHADVEIRAQLLGFSTENVKLMAKYEGQPAWEGATMRPDLEGNDFVFLFFDARERIDYFVEADGIRSATFSIDVSDVPAVSKLEILLTFPRHTSLGPKMLEDEGDIRALVGTVAEFTITADQAVQAGTVKFEDSEDIQLEVVSPTVLKGSFKVAQDDFYRIHLQNSEDVWSPSSDEFLVEALIDQPPSIAITRPRRDMKVTNLEEVFTEVKADDDYGLRELSLFFSVNGEPEQKVACDMVRGARSAVSSQTFYLEEYNLEPGDFISYYAQARDAVSDAQTDIYFLEVQPYDREYIQSQQAGGGGGGGGERDLMLSKGQKEIIAATFNVLRSKERTAAAEFDESVQTIALMQQQLEQQAQTIVERIKRRGPATQTKMFLKMVEYLEAGIEHMGNAHQNLNQTKPSEALPFEQKALQQLLRAEALFKEIQISMGQQEGGGGQSQAEDLADLVDLELDQKKNQYETLQQSRAQQQQDELDEAARKLKELAQRQQQEVERRRRQAQQSSSGGGGQSHQQLAEEIEEMARQLERLSREERDKQLDDVARQLRQAARDLKRSQNGQNPQQSQMEAEKALERLQQAQNQLNRQLNEQLKSSVQELVEKSQELTQRQEEVIDEVRELEARQKDGKVDKEYMKQLRGLLQEKGNLQEELNRLESQLHQTSKRLSSKQPNTSEKLKEAGLNVRDQRLPEKMQESSELLQRGWNTLARQREEGVAEHMQELTENIRQAQQAMGSNPMGSSPEERAEESLNQIGSLVENLEALKERAEAQQGQQQGQQGQQQGEQQGQQQGQQGQQQGEQQGQQQGQQGQQGQQQGEQQGQQGQQGQQQGQQGRQQGQQQGQAGRQSDGQQNQMGGSRRSAGRANPNSNAGGINPQQVRREWQERIQEAEDIGRGLRGTDPQTARDIAELARQMREIDAQRVLEDPEEVARLKSQIINGFRQLELEVYNKIKKQPEQLRLAHEEEVPAEYRNRVEEYYRSLAGAKKNKRP